MSWKVAFVRGRRAAMGIRGLEEWVLMVWVVVLGESFWYWGGLFVRYFRLGVRACFGLTRN